MATLMSKRAVAMPEPSKKNVFKWKKEREMGERRKKEAAGYVFVLVWIHHIKWKKTVEHCFEYIKSTLNPVSV